MPQGSVITWYTPCIVCSHIGPDDSRSGQPKEVAIKFLIKNCVTLNALLFYGGSHLKMDEHPDLKMSFMSLLIHYGQHAMLSGVCRG